LFVTTTERPPFSFRKVTAAQVKTLVAAFSDPSIVWANGVMLEEKRMLAIRADARSIYGRSGSSGFMCVKTSSAILIGYYNDRCIPGLASLTIEQLADYLLENGM